MTTEDELEPRWAPGTNTRGTLSLLFTCLLTMLLSVWSVIHMDIPEKRYRKSKWFWAKNSFARASLAVKTLLIPEFLGSTAVTQLREAVLLGLILEELGYGKCRKADRVVTNYMTSGEEKVELALQPLPQPEIGHDAIQINVSQEARADGTVPVGFNNPNRDPLGNASTSIDESPDQPTKGGILPFLGRSHLPQGLTRYFYIVMGGFEITNKSWDQEETMVVTPLGAALLARHGLLPHISLAEIEDKSKADVMAKILVCLQAGWMVIQCIVRKASGLPVTLLELTTIVNLIATMVIYFVWLQKPQDVHTPTEIGDPDNFLGVLLRTVVGARLECREYNPQDGIFRPGILRYENEQFSSDFYQGQDMSKLFGPWTQFQYEWLEITITTPPQINSPPKYPFVALRFDQGGINLTERQAQLLVQLFLFRARSVGVSVDKLRQWRDILEEHPFEGYCVVLHRHGTIAGDLSIGYNPTVYSASLLKGYKEPSRRVRFLLSSSLSGAIILIAVVYLTAWNDHFPSRVERIIWKVSVLVIFLKQVVSRGLYALTTWLTNCKKIKIPALMARLIQILAFWVFVSARIYLLVESILAMRSLRKGAYTTIEWLELMPHF